MTTIRTYKSLGEMYGRDLCADHAPAQSLSDTVSEGREGTCVECAKAVMHRVLSTGHMGKVERLIPEWRKHVDTGASGNARAVSTTIDDLVGYRDNGKWIGAAQIEAAMAATGRQVAS